MYAFTFIPYLGSIFFQKAYIDNALRPPEFDVRNFSFPSVSSTYKWFRTRLGPAAPLEETALTT